jgi:tetratricopeptide (TPR) repeat protein
MLRSRKESDKPKALEFFILNTENFPSSFNAYDSLGEAYVILGDKKKAIENYKKLLELYPYNEDIKIKIESLNKNK